MILEIYCFIPLDMLQQEQLLKSKHVFPPVIALVLFSVVVVFFKLDLIILADMLFILFVFL